MNASIVVVAVGLVALALDARGRGRVWSECVAPMLALAVTQAVVGLLDPRAWSAALAFALLALGAWRAAELPWSLSALLVLLTGVLEPTWIPAAIAVAVERRPSERLRLLGVAVALACLAGAVLGGQALLGRSLLAFRDSLVARVPDLRHENATLVAGVAVIGVVALLARAAARPDRRALYLYALGAEVLLAGTFGRSLAVLPLLVFLALPPSGIAAPALLAATLAAANGLVTRLRIEEPVWERAETLERAFGPSDVLVFHLRPSFELEYYAELPSVALPEDKPHEALQAELDQPGRRVWIHVDERGQPMLGNAFPTDAHLRRLLWGITVGAGGLRLRELRGITSRAPCASPGLAGKDPKLRAHAIGWFEPESGRLYAPERAIDGDPKTEWLAPKKPLPWLDLALDEPRSISSVRLLGAQNLPYRDFEPRSAHVELLSGQTLVASTDVGLAGGEWRELRLRGDKIDCVRVVLLSHRGRGGGLAELELR